MKFRIASSVITVTHPSRRELIAAVRQRLAARQGFALATINLDHLVKLHLTPAFRMAYARQDIVVADGNPIVWLSRLAGRPVSLVTGSDLVLPLAGEAAASGATVALVGSTPAVLSAAAQEMAARTPGLRVVLQLSPAFGFDPESDAAADVLAQVRDSGAQLCFLAFGAPKQEILAARGRRIAPETGFVSVGAGLDFLAGSQVRAPSWMRRIAMEWLWRALSSPRRLIPRYLACFAILPSEMWRAVKLRLVE
ncbi:MAG: WecB/TagA/CpsF family glycosyltransferase [Paracoccaceae bacterium]